MQDLIQQTTNVKRKGEKKTVSAKIHEMIPTEIISYLQNKHHSKAILLHGSRARGDAFDQSDYDLALIVEYPDQIRPERYQGCALDINGISSTEQVLKAGQTPVWPVVVLYDDEDGLGKRLAQQTQKAFKEGPTALTKEEFENRCNFSKRLLQRIQGRGQDSMMRFYYMGDFYPRALRYWCELHQRWTLPVHLLIPLIAAEDPAFYQELQNFWTEKYQDAALRIHRCLFENEDAEQSRRI